MAKNIVNAYTDEEKAIIKKGWDEGMSARDISALLIGRTRNAILGYAHRAELESRASSSGGRNRKAVPQRIWQRTAAAPKPPKKELTVHEPVTMSGKMIGMLELLPGMCKFAINEGEPKFYFCGNPAPEGASYCDGHAKICHGPTHPYVRSEYRPRVA